MGLKPSQLTLETHAPERSLFDRLWNIDMEDGVITIQEKNFLRLRAIPAGISEEEFEDMVSKTKHNS